MMRMRPCLLTLLCVLLLPGVAGAEGAAAPLRPFSVHDLDRDGYLSRQEYARLLELRRARARQGGAGAMVPAPDFGDVDRDRDGRIGVEELTDAAAFTARRHRHRHRGHGAGWRWPAPPREGRLP
jgi:hypothetical protein